MRPSLQDLSVKACESGSSTISEQKSFPAPLLFTRQPTSEQIDKLSHPCLVLHNAFHQNQSHPAKQCQPQIELKKVKDAKHGHKHMWLQHHRGQKLCCKGNYKWHPAFYSCSEVIWGPNMDVFRMLFRFKNNLAPNQTQKMRSDQTWQAQIDALAF